MWDTGIPWIDLAMERDDLENIPAFALPEGYGWRFYRPGDEIEWARIEMTAGEFKCIEEGLERFNREFPQRDALPDRMVFITCGGVPCATATAWFEPDGRGHLHYVGVEADHQGKGLCRPLLSIVLGHMRQLGHTRARLTTQTTSWLAIRLYGEFGFHPVPMGAGDESGWALVNQKAGTAFEL